MRLREAVIIKTPTGDLHGELFVGADGLPELNVDTVPFHAEYRPATFPATWTVCYRLGNTSDTLIRAWRCLLDLRQEIIEAQREAEDENDVYGF